MQEILRSIAYSVFSFCILTVPHDLDILQGEREERRSRTTLASAVTYMLTGKMGQARYS